jgi:hypothetical protein
VTDIPVVGITQPVITVPLLLLSPQQIVLPGLNPVVAEMPVLEIPIIDQLHLPDRQAIQEVVIIEVIPDQAAVQTDRIVAKAVHRLLHILLVSEVIPDLVHLRQEARIGPVIKALVLVHHQADHIAVVLAIGLPLLDHHPHPDLIVEAAQGPADHTVVEVHAPVVLPVVPIVAEVQVAHIVEEVHAPVVHQVVQADREVPADDDKL